MATIKAKGAYDAWKAAKVSHGFQIPVFKDAILEVLKVFKSKEEWYAKVGVEGTGKGIDGKDKTINAVFLCNITIFKGVLPDERVIGSDDYIHLDCEGLTFDCDGRMLSLAGEKNEVSNEPDNMSQESHKAYQKSNIEVEDLGALTIEELTAHQLRELLSQRGIDFKINANRYELLELVKQHL